jgi:FkbM family methyltransferase
MNDIVEYIDTLLIKFKNMFSLSGIYNFCYRSSYSQEGEDMILSNIFANKKAGFYVDIGAHHPFIYSNTCYFYNKGWSGINIDPNTGTKKIFDKYRKRDINLELGVGLTNKILKYYRFSTPALNGFNEIISKNRQNIKGVTLKDKIKVKTKPLSEILDQYLPQDKNIGFFNIDTEGMEYEVLKSNNWNKYHPDCILVEILETNLNDITKNVIYKYLTNRNYEFFAKSGNSSIFLDKNFII